MTTSLAKRKLISKDSLLPQSSVPSPTAISHPARPGFTGLAAWISTTPVFCPNISLIPYSGIEHGSDITDWDTAEEPWGPDTGFIGVSCILILTCEFAVFWDRIAVLHAVDLVADEGAGRGVRWILPKRETGKEMVRMPYLMLISSTSTPPQGFPGFN